MWPVTFPFVARALLAGCVADAVRWAWVRRAAAWMPQTKAQARALEAKVNAAELDAGRDAEAGVYSMRVRQSSGRRPYADAVLHRHRARWKYDDVTAQPRPWPRSALRGKRTASSWSARGKICRSS